MADEVLQNAWKVCCQRLKEVSAELAVVTTKKEELQLDKHNLATIISALETVVGAEPEEEKFSMPAPETSRTAFEMWWGAQPKHGPIKDIAREAWLTAWGRDI